MVWPQSMGSDVLIGVVGKGGVDEQFARHALDGAQHPRIANAAAPELHDQADLVRLTRHGERSPMRFISVCSDSELLCQRAKGLFAKRGGQRLERHLVGEVKL